MRARFSLFVEQCSRQHVENSTNYYGNRMTEVESIAWQQTNTKEKAAFPLLKIPEMQKASFSQLKKCEEEEELPMTYTQMNKTMKVKNLFFENIQSYTEKAKEPFQYFCLSLRTMQQSWIKHRQTHCSRTALTVLESKKSLQKYVFSASNISYMVKANMT